MPLKRSLFIGLMSGTSLDGIDAALVDFAAPVPRTRATHFAPFAAPLRAALLALQAAGSNELHTAALAANQLAHAYASAVQALLDQAKMDAGAIEAIGAHGQTVRHRPELGFTIQLNNPALLAELTGIAVCADFRSRDVAAGGQGAPLTPAFHHAVFGAPDCDRVIVNIGGIANITHLPAAGAASGSAATRTGRAAPLAARAPRAVTGFDSGPGNVLMDWWAQRHRGQAYDADGVWAASGTVLPALLAAMLADPYFALLPPKSTGRDRFHGAWLQGHLDALHLRGDAHAADVQASLCALTAHSICAGIRQYAGSHAREAFICGGGAHNAQLVKLLGVAAPALCWQATDALGVPADWVEAVAFAWLAHRFMLHQPGNLTSVTGARGARLLGALYPA